MNIATSDIQSLAARVGALERENRVLKGAAVTLFTVVCILVLMGQAQPNRSVVASKFILRDNGGRVRATLGFDAEDKPSFILSDANGFPVLSLVGGSDPFLTLNRVGNREQVTVMASKDLYGLAIYGDAKGSANGIRAGLGVWKGVPGLSLYDETGNERAAIQTEKEGPSVRLSDAKGNGRVTLGLGPSDSPSLTFFDARGAVAWSTH